MRVFGYLVIFLDSWVTLIDAETAFRWQRLFIRNVRYNKRSFSAIFSFYFLFSLTSFELFELLFPVRKRRRKEMISWPFEFRLWSFTEDDVHLDSLWRKGHGRGCFMFSFFFFFFLEGRLICQTQEQVFWKRYHWINHSFRNRYEHSSFRKLQFLTQPDSQHRKNQKGKKTNEKKRQSSRNTSFFDKSSLSMLLFTSHLLPLGRRAGSSRSRWLAPIEGSMAEPYRLKIRSGIWKTRVVGTP